MKNRSKFVAAWVLITVTTGLWAADSKLEVPQKKSQKTVITGDSFIFNPVKKTAIYNGNVVVIDPGMDLLCDKLTVYFADKKKTPKKLGAPSLPPPRPKKDPAKTEGEVIKKPSVAPMIGLGGDIDRIIAEGDVEIINKKDKTRAEGGYAVYLAATEVLVLTINPRLYTKQGILSGRVIEYNRVTGELSAKQVVLENQSKPESPQKKPPSR